MLHASAGGAPALSPAEAGPATNMQPIPPSPTPAERGSWVPAQPPGVAPMLAGMLPSTPAQPAIPSQGSGTPPASIAAAPGSISAVIGPTMPSNASASGMSNASLPADLLAQVNLHLRLYVSELPNEHAAILAQSMGSSPSDAVSRPVLHAHESAFQSNESLSNHANSLCGCSHTASSSHTDIGR